MLFILKAFQFPLPYSIELGHLLRRYTKANAQRTVSTPPLRFC